MKYRFILAIVALIVGWCTAAERKPLRHSSVLNMAGGRQTSRSYSNLGSAGGIGGLTLGSNGTRGQGGPREIICPLSGIDTDADGLCDDIDPDNDNDGLLDLDEINGTAFDLQTPTAVLCADSDGDGVSDGMEAVCGTDPLNKSHRLRIIAIERGCGGVRLGWIARSGKFYRVRCTDDLTRPAADARVLETLTVEGPGVGPWEICTNYYFDGVSSDLDRKFYTIEAVGALLDRQP